MAKSKGSTKATKGGKAVAQAPEGDAADPNRAVFYGCGAHVGRVDSEYVCGFWSENPLTTVPQFDPTRLTTIDLRRSPRYTARANVACDDFITDGGQTNIGPGFPSGNFMGACYLEEDYWRSLPAPQRPAMPPKGSSAHDYEYKSALYWPGTGDPRAGARYIGTHAKIASAVPGAPNVFNIDIWVPGTSGTAAKPQVRLMIDLSSIAMCDPQSMGGLTRINAANPAAALFVAMPLATSVGLAAGPKLPWWRGE
jgi:hypothetical protein